MITCKEDLINTYVKNTDEVRGSYAGLCFKFGIPFSSNANSNGVIDHTNAKYVEVGGNAWFYTNYPSRAIGKELEPEDLKPKRTKVEFIKVDFASDKEMAEEFLKGGLRYFTHGEVKGDLEKDTIPVTRLDELLCSNGIYRRIEAEMTERDIFIEECEKFSNHAKKLSIDEKRIVERMFDSGGFKFVGGKND